MKACPTLPTTLVGLMILATMVARNLPLKMSVMALLLIMLGLLLVPIMRLLLALLLDVWSLKDLNTHGLELIGSLNSFIVYLWWCYTSCILFNDQVKSFQVLIDLLIFRVY